MKQICLLLYPFTLVYSLIKGLGVQKQLHQWWFEIKIEWNYKGNHTIDYNVNPIKSVSGKFTNSDKKIGDFLFHILPTNFRLSKIDVSIFENTHISLLRQLACDALFKN